MSSAVFTRRGGIVQDADHRLLQCGRPIARSMCCTSSSKRNSLTTGRAGSLEQTRAWARG